MRINHKSRPEVGEYRKIRKFLYFPKRIGNQTRWWETSQWLEMYGAEINFFGIVVGKWEPRNWQEIQLDRVD